MKVFAIIAILALATVSCADSICPSFKCATVDVPEGSCVKNVLTEGQKVGHISLKCKAPAVCPVMDALSQMTDETKCATPAEVKLTNQVDGQACEADKITCFDKVTCTDKKCVGLKVDSECTDPHQCATGLSCQEGKCKAQISDDKKCANDYDCVNNKGCLEGKCTEYGSLDAGKDPKGNALLCKSFEVVGESYLCGTLKLDDDLKCKADQKECKYTVVTDKETKGGATKECMCNFSNAKEKYCQPDSTKNGVRSVKFNTSVHTSLRITDTPVSITSAWPISDGIDSCLKALINTNYIKAAFGLVAALVVLL